ncbi:unnamed protein product, partial [Ectocarpus sp. 12 AP-2014]
MGPAGSPSRGEHAVAPPPPLAHALSGAVGAVVAMALLYPLDQVRAILQVDDDLARECSAPGGAGVLGALSRLVRRHGRAGLWRGMVPVLITMGVSNFVYFYCFTGMKAALLSRRRLLRARGVQAGGAAKPLAGGAGGEGGGGLTPLESVVASTIAGVINVLATTPLWVSNLRIKAGNGVGGLLSTLGSIGRHEGLAGLWSGTAPSLVLVSNPIIQFVVYETLKQALGRRHSHRNGDARRIIAQPPDPRSPAGGGSRGSAGRPSVGLRSHEAFLLGATAKTISTLVTYPLQLAQAKLRAGRAARGGGPWQGQCNEQDDSSSPGGARGGLRSGVAWQLLTCWSGTVDVLVSVCRRNGVGGMYQGMRAKLVHTVLTSALLFLGYERLLEVIANSMAAKAEAPPPPLLPVPGST